MSKFGPVTYWNDSDQLREINNPSRGRRRFKQCGSLNLRMTQCFLSSHLKKKKLTNWSTLVLSEEGFLDYSLMSMSLQPVNINRGLVLLPLGQDRGLVGHALPFSLPGLFIG